MSEPVVPIPPRATPPSPSSGVHEPPYPPRLTSTPPPPPRASPANPAPLPFPVFLLPPPYEARLSYPDPRTLRPGELRLGSLLGLELGPARAEWSEVQQAVEYLRRRAPGAPVVLSLAPDESEAWDVLTRLAHLPVRAVLLRGAVSSTILRQQLTRPFDLGADVVDWLTLRGLRLSPMTSYLLRQLFTHAPSHPETSSFMRSIGVPESSARFRFRKKQLPSPGRWLQAARALHAALRLQSSPRIALLRLAHSMGYADHSALSHQMQRLFRLRPGEIRQLLGWEWLLERWLETEAQRRPLFPDK